MEPFKILRHPAAWAIFATDIIGWNCHFHLVIISTSRTVFSSCPSCCQSYCSIIYRGYTGSAWLEAALHCILPCPQAFPQHLPLGSSRGVGALLMSLFSPSFGWELFFFFFACEYSVHPPTAGTRGLSGICVPWSMCPTVGLMVSRTATNASSAMHTCTYGINLFTYQVVN